MLHQIQVEKLGERGKSMAHAIETCVHCGFCLPACPTYQVLGEEADSPRGRILLMKHVLEGELTPEQAAPHIDRCLGCLACETNCPSGVPYSHLLSPYRDLMRQRGHGPTSLARRLALHTLPYPNRFRWAMRTGKWAKPLARYLPKSLQSMLDLVPDYLPEQDRDDREMFPALGKRRGCVALLAGCAQRVLEPGIHRAAISVLNQNGFDVAVPKGQGCCGALAWHVGHGTVAQRQAIHNMQVFPKEVDAVLSTAAGCGSAMHEYPILLKGTEHEDEAKRFAARSRDVLTFLDEVGIETPPKLSRPLRVAYHDACHLAHAQKVVEPPRRLLERISNLKLVPVSESDLCCGSAGTYNMDQPEVAESLGRRKAENIVQSGCDFVALANIGCQIQIANHLRSMGCARPILHVIQVLDAAYRHIEIA